MQKQIFSIMKSKKRKNSYVFFVIKIFLFCILSSFIIGTVIGFVNTARYREAEKFLLEKDYERANELFEKLGYFKDSYERRSEAIRGLMFNQAKELEESQNYEAAIEKYEEIISLSNTDDEMKLDCENAAIKLRYDMAEALYNDGDDEEATKNFEKILELYSDCRNDYILKSKDKIMEIKHSLAKAYFDNGQYIEAEPLFIELGDYKDSRAYVARIATINDMKNKEAVYNKAILLMENGKYEEAIQWFTDIENYPGSKDKIEECKKMLKMMDLNHVITTGVNNSFAIDLNHDVKSVGKNTEHQREVNNDNWKNIISLDCYGSLTIGLNSDHKVVIAGLYNVDKTVNMEDLENIIDVAAGQQFVAALDKDGQVYADGLYACNWDLSEWNDVIDIDAGWDFLVGLTENHELRFVGKNTKDFKDEYVVSDWKNVISISAGGGGNDKKKRGDGYGHIVGLKKDGTIIAIGDDSYGQCSEAVNNWDKVVRISAGDWYTVGLTETGGVLITGINWPGSYYIDRSLGKEGLQKFDNIVEVAAGFGQTICLRSDGTVYSFGFDQEDNPNELYKTREWYGLLLPPY